MIIPEEIQNAIDDVGTKIESDYKTANELVEHYKKLKAQKPSIIKDDVAYTLSLNLAITQKAAAKRKLDEYLNFMEVLELLENTDIH